MIVNWQIWLPANLVNFRFVPVPYQVLFANGTSTIYNACLSYIHNNMEEKTPEKIGKAVEKPTEDYRVEMEDPI